MRGRHKPHALMAEINITPFTDVILVLLIIFIIATPLISQNAIEIKLPQAASKVTVDNPRQVYVTISSEGIIYLENKILTNKELQKRIGTLLGKDQDLKVIVAADRACRFQDVVQVMDTLKESGVRSLNIATRTDYR